MPVVRRPVAAEELHHLVRVRLRVRVRVRVRARVRVRVRARFRARVRVRVRVTAAGLRRKTSHARPAPCAPASTLTPCTSMATLRSEYDSTSSTVMGTPSETPSISKRDASSTWPG